MGQGTCEPLRPPSWLSHGSSAAAGEPVPPASSRAPPRPCAGQKRKWKRGWMRAIGRSTGLELVGCSWSTWLFLFCNILMEVDIFYGTISNKAFPRGFGLPQPDTAYSDFNWWNEGTSSLRGFALQRTAPSPTAPTARGATRAARTTSTRRAWASRTAGTGARRAASSSTITPGRSALARSVGTGGGEMGASWLEGSRSGAGGIYSYF